MSVTAATAIAYAGYAAEAVGAAGAAYSAYSSHEAGVATANADKEKARVAAMDATQKTIDQRQNMLRALASQNAYAGVGGIGTGGGFGANVGRQITQNQNDLMVTDANGSAQVSLLDQAAGNAEAEGNAQAASGLIKYAGSQLNSYANR